MSVDNGGTAGTRMTRITFTNNKGTAAAGPQFVFAHVDGLTVTGNVQSLTSGVLTSITDCTEVTALTIAASTVTLAITLPANGTVTKSPDQATYAYNASVTLTATPAAGYTFAGWSGDLTGSTNPATIAMTGNKTVTATFTAIPTYTLTLSAGTGGTITPSTPQTVSQGSSKYFAITPGAGYHILDVTVDSSSMGAVATYTFTNVQASHTIYASFAPDAYTLTITPPVNGTVTKDPDQATYAYNASVTLTATPATGYTFTGWSGDLTGSTNPATITMDGNKTATASFTALPTYTLTPSAGPGGTIAPNTPQTVSQGSSKYFAITPGADYHILDVTVDSSSVGPVTIYTFTDVQTSHAIHATFAPDAYTLTVTPPVNGTVTKDPDQATYAYGASVTLTPTPAAGYTFAGWSGDLTGTTNSATITMNGSKTVTAIFAVAPSRTLSVSIVGSGFVVKSPNMSSYPSGTVVTLTATPTAGYTFTGWSGDLTSSANPATITMDGNKTVTATFTAVPTYTLTPSAGTGGTITPSTPQTVPQGGSMAFTIAAVTGYHTLDVTVDGSSVGAMTTYTFTNVQPSHTIHASFAPDVYTLTVTPPVNGTVTKDPDQATYAYGASVTLTATPSPGYLFTGWSGSLTGSTNPGTVTMNGNRTVTATFIAILTYTLTVTPSPSTGGSIAKGLDQPSYLSGTVVTLTATPALGYAFTGWSGDLAGMMNPVTIAMDGNKTVTAAFAVAPPRTLTISVAGSGFVVKSPNMSSYLPGSVVTLTATPLAGSTFIGWSGDLSGSTNPTTVTMDADKTVTATFAPAFSASLSAGWNLISIPVPLPVSSILGLQAVYAYHDGWSVPTTLTPGQAYWVQVQNAVTVPLPGSPSTQPLPLAYQAGWQLLGNPFDVPLPISSITNHGLITTCNSYDAGWGILNPATDSLQPRKGYWINLSTVTTLTLAHP